MKWKKQGMESIRTQEVKEINKKVKEIKKKVNEINKKIESKGNQ